jgi:hypothetical protein
MKLAEKEDKFEYQIVVKKSIQGNSNKSHHSRNNSRSMSGSLRRRGRSIQSKLSKSWKSKESLKGCKITP